jgi:hypothetical protein
MSRPFDLAAARAGEPIEYGNSPLAYKAHYIGQSVGGFPVIQRMSGGGPFSCEFSMLSMAPKKVTVRYRVAVMQHNGVLSTASLTDGGHLTPNDVEKFAHFVEWIHTEWQVAEVPQGGE